MVAAVEVFAPTFDYDALDLETRVAIQQHENRLFTLLRQDAFTRLEIGRELVSIKERLGHGHWEAWVEAKCPWSIGTAKRLMQAAKRFPEIDQHDRFDATALYLLASEGTDEDIQAAIAAAGQGETITHAKAQELVSQSENTFTKSASQTPRGLGRREWNDQMDGLQTTLNLERDRITLLESLASLQDNLIAELLEHATTLPQHLYSKAQRVRAEKQSIVG